MQVVRFGFVSVLLLSTLGCDDTIFGGGGVVHYPPGWVGVVALIEGECVSCHPVLEDPDLLVEIPQDIADETGVYVVPGDPENSYLWQLISGSDPEYFMPMGLAEPLPLETVQNVEKWILEGAVIPSEDAE
jgi:hypothetical protein